MLTEEQQRRMILDGNVCAVTIALLTGELDEAERKLLAKAIAKDERMLQLLSGKEAK